jgi:hypothetical protein
MALAAFALAGCSAAPVLPPAPVIHPSATETSPVFDAPDLSSQNSITWATYSSSSSSVVGGASPRRMSTVTLDVACAGVAGAHVAWRLSADDGVHSIATGRQVCDETTTRAVVETAVSRGASMMVTLEPEPGVLNAWAAVPLAG